MRNLSILRFENDQLLRDDLKMVFGGRMPGGFDSGHNCSVKCKNKKYITGAPDCSAATQKKACDNQGGASGACGGGPGC